MHVEKSLTAGGTRLGQIGPISIWHNKRHGSAVKDRLPTSFQRRPRWNKPLGKKTPHAAATAETVRDKAAARKDTSTRNSESEGTKRCYRPTAVGTQRQLLESNTSVPPPRCQLWLDPLFVERLESVCSKQVRDEGDENT